MKNLLCFFNFFLMLSLSVYANSASKYELSINDLYDKSLATKDSTYAGHAYNRCSALFLLMNAFLERDGREAVWDNEIPVQFHQIAVNFFQEKLRKNNATKENIKSMEEMALAQHKEHMGKYKDWILSNQLDTGDSWSGDQELMNEINTCVKFGRE